VLQVEEGSLYPALQRMLLKGGSDRGQSSRPLLHAHARRSKAARH
jgi:hypothetical protein